MSTALNICLIILVVVLIIAAITVTVYLVKFLIELCLLTKNLTETTDIVKRELDPIMVEVKEVLHNVNYVTKAASTQFQTIKKIVSTVIGFASMFTGKFKFLSNSFFKGFSSAVNLFRKK